MPTLNADGNNHNCECSTCAERYKALEQIHSWLVCHTIASAEDMAASFFAMEELARKAID